LVTARGPKPPADTRRGRGRHQLLRHRQHLFQRHSEEIVGRALRDFARRDETRRRHQAALRLAQGAQRRGLSRKAILAEIDASLQRLGMDYVDLYQIHRWDPDTPIEETMEALHDVVKAGKARYIGASSMYAWQFAKAQQVAAAHGWTRFVSMQNH
jgi:1-deoxyxylulose-5-phosphate synthase